MRRGVLSPSGAALLPIVLLLAGAGCAGGKKQAAIVQPRPTPTASFDHALDLLSRHQLRQAMAALKRIQFSGETRAEIEPLTRLALADATYYQNTTIAWIDARNLYLDFVTLNGDHSLAPYAQLQVGLCSLKQVSAPSKDQALTRQAIRDLEAVGRRWPDSVYADAARSMLREARANMAESEFLVGRFYLKKRSYEAAIERFRGILIGFPDYPESEKVLYYLAQSHARNGESAEARLYLDRIVATHPDGEYVSQAKQTLRSISGEFQTSVGRPGASE